MSEGNQTMEEMSKYKMQLGLVSQIEQYLVNFKKTSQDRRTMGYIQGRKQGIAKLWDKFSENHLLLLSLKEEGDEVLPYFAKNDYERLEESYFELLGELNDYLDGFRNDAKAVTASLKESGDEPESMAAAKVKLPTIPLPKFSGKYNDWAPYRDMFRAMIVNNSTLTSVQKTHYLLMSVTGEAESYLKHFTPTAANFLPAWQTLCNRYDNTRALVHNQLRTLFSQPNVTSESAYWLRKLIDVTRDCLSSLRNLGVQVENWDPILIYQIVQRLPSDTHQLWEQSLGATRDLPTFKSLEDFLEARFRTLEALAGNKTRTTPAPERKHVPVSQQSYHLEQKIICPNCKATHPLRECAKFLQMSALDRQQFARKNSICFNCLAQSHMRNRCSSKGCCQKCGRKHNTLLHNDSYVPTAQSSSTTNQPTSQGYSLTVGNSQPAATTSGQAPSQSDTAKSEQCVSAMHARNQNGKHTLLATALIKAKAEGPLFHTLRALIDPGSQASFITETAAQLLKAQKLPTSVTVTGLGGKTTGRSHHMVNIKIASRFEQAEFNLNAIAMPSLTNVLPSHTVPMSLVVEFEDLQLADPLFSKPGGVDLILGADIYPKILETGIRTSSDGNLLAQKTKLGWILSGSCQDNPNSSPISSFFNSLELDEQLKRFWELEDITNPHPVSEDDKECEDIFRETFTRQAEGRYMVTLPFREQPSTLGQSRNIAMARYKAQEKRFERDPKLRQEYDEVLQEYISLGHLEEVNYSEAAQDQYYLPHHAVIKEESQTTKLRVVFNASSRTTTHKSLNDILYVGPKLQQDISSIISRWRKMEFVFTADITKMYRQIWVAKSDTDLQRILWRPTPNSDIKDFRLMTVTFGVNCAPYLAIRVLHQLAEDEKQRYPIGSKIILSDMYVDDILSGGSTISEAETARRQISDILKSGGFELRKWASNRAELLADIAADDRLMEIPINLQKDHTIKALGIRWDPISDNLYFQAAVTFSDKPPTKRRVLSTVAQLFDPLGWVAPLVVTGKIFMQRLWLAGLDWDQELPPQLKTDWVNFQKSLAELPVIQIPRWIHTGPRVKSTQLHGFSDASERAYAACVYLRLVDDDDNVFVHLLTAKTRVAPVKSISIPRLELCGALLLSTLIANVRRTMGFEAAALFAWTDSTIVLTWIHDHPSRWKTFIATRVTKILKLGEPNIWNHVATHDNPADHASRGLPVADLLNNTQWWNGPNWLKTKSEDWPRTNWKPAAPQDLEERHEKSCLLAASSPAQWDLCRAILTRISSFNRLIRTTAYVLRFLWNATPSKSIPRRTGPLSVPELTSARNHIIRYVQGTAFADEIQSLKNKEEISSHSKLKALTPFLDRENILRVGGRLSLSDLPYERKFPIILPSDKDNDVFAKLIIAQAHADALHGSIALTLEKVRLEYWIVRARNHVKYYVQRCLRCFRLRRDLGQQIMGNLPTERSAVTRPFTNVGVDYAGPIQLKMAKGRGIRAFKGFIAVFICFSTKAVHLEAVSDLSTEAFLAALKRFVARRGLCANLYSDCGTNFVGASNQLERDLKKSMAEFSVDIAEQLAKEKIKWHFIPPGSPHFGGLWESGVKVMKHHLRRILGNSIVTFEELSTLLAQIEACMNSRPLTPLTEDPESLNVLTPGHFLIGDALLAPPEGDLMDARESGLKRWQYIQRLKQHFWHRWSTEYLSQLQQRTKWKDARPNPEIGDIILFKDERMPPLKWPLGRIIATHPGQDGFVRVVTFKTANTTLQRPITKICVLPKDFPGEEQNKTATTRKTKTNRRKRT